MKKTLLGLILTTTVLSGCVAEEPVGEVSSPTFNMVGLEEYHDKDNLTVENISSLVNKCQDLTCAVLVKKAGEEVVTNYGTIIGNYGRDVYQPIELFMGREVGTLNFEPNPDQEGARENLSYVYEVQERDVTRAEDYKYAPSLSLVDQSLKEFSSVTGVLYSSAELSSGIGKEFDSLQFKDDSVFYTNLIVNRDDQVVGVYVEELDEDGESNILHNLHQVRTEQ